MAASAHQIEQALSSQLAEAVRVAEEQVDDELRKMDDMDEDGLEAIRRRRAAQLRDMQKQRQEQTSLGHGRYEAIPDERSFFDATKKSNKLVCHFYTDSAFRCKIVDKHLALIAQRHFGARFVKLNVEKADFLARRLNIRVIPSIACIVDQKTVDWIRGFDELGGHDEFSTETLEKRLARSGVIEMPELPRKDKNVATTQKTIRSTTAKYENEDDW